MKEPVRYGPKGPCGWANVTSCGQIGFKGMIVGGIEAAPMEFPHMAGEHNKKTEIRISAMVLNRSSWMEEGRWQHRLSLWWISDQRSLCIDGSTLSHV